MKKLLLIGMLFGTSVHAGLSCNATQGTIEVMVPRKKDLAFIKCPTLKATIRGGQDENMRSGHTCNPIELNFRKIGTSEWIKAKWPGNKHFVIIGLPDGSLFGNKIKSMNRAYLNIDVRGVEVVFPDGAKIKVPEATDLREGMKLAYIKWMKQSKRKERQFEGFQ